MKKNLLKCVLILLLCIAQAYAQNRKVTGQVTSKDDGQPTPGVSVRVKGTNNGVQTGSDGKYMITVPENGVLTFTFLGYTPQEIPADKPVINVVLQLNSRQLGEVVVTGLGINKAKRTLGYAQ